MRFNYYADRAMQALTVVLLLQMVMLVSFTLGWLFKYGFTCV